MQKADDVVLAPVADWIAREPLLHRHLNALFQRVLKIEADHVRARNHDLAHGEIGEVKDVVDEFQFRLINEALAMTLLHEDADLLFRMRHILLLRHDGEAHAFLRPVRDVIQQPDERIHDALEDEERQGDRERDTLDLANRNVLRNQLAAHDVQRGDEKERNGEGDGFNRTLGHAEPRKCRMQQGSDDRFAEPAQAQGNDGDAKLRDGKRHVKAIGQLFRIRCAAIALGDENVEPGTAHLDDGKLRCNEERIAEDEQKDDKNFQRQ